MRRRTESRVPFVIRSRKARLGTSESFNGNVVIASPANNASATRVRAICHRWGASARDAVLNRRICAGGRRSDSRLSAVRQLSYS